MGGYAKPEGGPPESRVLRDVEPVKGEEGHSLHGVKVGHSVCLSQCQGRPSTLLLKYHVDSPTPSAITRPRGRGGERAAIASRALLAEEVAVGSHAMSTAMLLNGHQAWSSVVGERVVQEAACAATQELQGHAMLIRLLWWVGRVCSSMRG